MVELTPGTVFAGHRIDGVAGRGGMGVVYRATHLALNRPVALKVVSPELSADPTFRERFKQESQTAASLQHPNVIPIYHAGEENGELYITMLFVEGTDLRQLIRDRGALDPRLGADLIAQVAAALDAAHARGLVHRDVKPANVLIDEAGGDQRAYLTDFGLTKADVGEGGLTKPGTFVGTLDYIAPEQLRGERVDARADVYALGCVLYQALTGTVPYPRDSDPAKIWAHIGEPPPSVAGIAPSVPDEFEEVVQRAMDKDPARRYPSTGDLGRAARSAARGRTLTSPERSVALGQAAPTLAPQATVATAPPPPTQPGLPGAPPPVTAAGPTDLAAGYGQPVSPYGPGPTAPPAPPPGAPPQPPGGAPIPHYGTAPPPRGRRGPLLALIAVGVLALAGAVAALLLLGGGTPEGGEIAGTTQLDKDPVAFDVGEGSVWVSNRDRTVQQLDPESRSVVGTLRLEPRAAMLPMFAGAGAVWVDTFTDVISRINATTRELVTIRRLPATRTGGRILTGDDAGLWMLNPETHQVNRVDPDTNKADPPIAVDRRVENIDAGDGLVYLTRSDGKLDYIDERSKEPIDRTVGFAKTTITQYDGGILYGLTEGRTEIVRLNTEQGDLGSPIKLSGKATDFSVAGESVWVAYAVERKLERINLGTGEVVGEPIKLGKSPQDVEPGEGYIWVLHTGNDGTLTQIRP